MSDVILTGAEIAAAVPEAVGVVEPLFSYRVRGSMIERNGGSGWTMSLLGVEGFAPSVRALFAERAHRAQREAGATGTAEHWKAVAAECEARAVAEAQRADTAEARIDALAWWLSQQAHTLGSLADGCGSVIAEDELHRSPDIVGGLPDVLDALRELRKQREGGV